MPRWDPLKAVLMWSRGVGCGKWPRVGDPPGRLSPLGKGQGAALPRPGAKKSVSKCLPGAFSRPLIGVQRVSGCEVGD